MTPKRLECWYVGTMLVVIGWCVEIRDQEKNTGIWFKSVRDEHEGTPKFDGHPQLKHCFFVSIFGSKPWHPNRQKPWNAIVLGFMGASRSSSCPSWETCGIQETLLWLLGRETKGGEPVKMQIVKWEHPKDCKTDVLRFGALLASDFLWQNLGKPIENHRKHQELHLSTSTKDSISTLLTPRNQNVWKHLPRQNHDKRPFSQIWFCTY